MTVSRDPVKMLMGPRIFTALWAANREGGLLQIAASKALSGSVASFLEIMG